MEAPKDYSLTPAAAGTQQSSAPLAPSQEAAYRKKCIQLKRRLTEIETNNDATRRRIEQEKEHVKKMRLVRAILLDHLKKIAETPGKRLTPEQLEELGLRADGRARVSEMVGIDGELRPDGEGLLDDSSDDDEEDPEPAERPERKQRRTNNSYRESIMTTTPGPNPSMYQQPGLPNLAPASSFSPAAPRDPAALTSSFRVNNTSQAAAAPAYPPQQQYPSEYQQSSPLAHAQNPAYTQPPHIEAPGGSPGAAPGGGPRSLPPQPQRPPPPFQQFTDHMRPQLEADDYPLDQIDSRIDQEWRNLSKENRELWDNRYAEQMMEYTAAMDDWKRHQKKVNNSVAGRSRPSILSTASDTQDIFDSLTISAIIGGKWGHLVNALDPPGLGTAEVFWSWSTKPQDFCYCADYNYADLQSSTMSPNFTQKRRPSRTSFLIAANPAEWPPLGAGTPPHTHQLDPSKDRSACLGVPMMSRRTPGGNKRMQGGLRQHESKALFKRQFKIDHPPGSDGPTWEEYCEEILRSTAEKFEAEWKLKQCGRYAGPNAQDRPPAHPEPDPTPAIGYHVASASASARPDYGRAGGLVAPAHSSGRRAPTLVNLEPLLSPGRRPPEKDMRQSLLPGPTRMSLCLRCAPLSLSYGKG